MNIELSIQQTVLLGIASVLILATIFNLTAPNPASAQTVDSFFSSLA